MIIPLSELLILIPQIGTADESNLIPEAMRSLRNSGNLTDYETARQVLSKRMNELADQFAKEIAEMDELIRRHRHD